jgi:hypothetical protein
LPGASRARMKRAGLNQAYGFKAPYLLAGPPWGRQTLAIAEHV